METDSSWYGRRFNALLVDFPEELRGNASLPTEACRNWDTGDVLDGLSSIHSLLVGVSSKMLGNDGNGSIEDMISELHLLWLLGCLSNVVMDGNAYCLGFTKEALQRYKTTRIAPKDFSKVFNGLGDHGIQVDFRKGEAKPKKQTYTACDNGIVHFDDRCTALGLWLFANRLLEKRWYWEDDKAGNYAAGGIKPLFHCIEPFYRADMRVFTVSDRLRFDHWEHYAGYSGDIIALAKRIDHHIRTNYPEYRTGQGFYRRIFASISYNRGFTERLLLCLGVGHNEDAIGYYSTLNGKEVRAFLEDIDSFSPRVTGCFLHPAGCACADCLRNPKTLTYRGEEYNNPYTAYEFRFPINSEEAVDEVIRLSDIKACHELGIKRQ